MKKEEIKGTKIVHPNLLPATFGQKAADRLTQIAGSWAFIITFILMIAFWIILNAVWLISKPLDPFPFILLNLALSTVAAIQAPIILMTQNRANQKDRLRAEYDYAVNRKSEREIEDIKRQLDRIERKLK